MLIVNIMLYMNHVIHHIETPPGLIPPRLPAGGWEGVGVVELALVECCYLTYPTIVVMSFLLSMYKIVIILIVFRS